MDYEEQLRKYAELVEEQKKSNEEFFQQTQNYNKSIVTVGYATFFGVLLYLSGKGVAPSEIKWALLALVASALVFVLWELWRQIDMSFEASKAGQFHKQYFRTWGITFFTSVLLGLIAVATIVYVLLVKL